ncbi:DUF2884 family protein [Salinimonas chungwhensis]|uniref:DUF2884 family protein n=1 Tax=Salinimonas chungwhensis TaxID=265425 RepID=UPI0003782559|nr:DUF2884 family protein [Salinimonas chungwhensis]
MMMQKLFYTAFAGLFFISASPLAAAEEFTCDIDFSYGLVVNDEQIRVMEKSRTLLQINDQNQLFINGRWQQLTPQQSAWLTEYAQGLHYVVPQMIVLATEGVDLAVDTIDHVYQGLVGADHDSYERLHEAMEKVKDRVKEKFRHASDHYFIGPGSLESVDDFVDAEIEAQLDGTISTTVGGILSAIGGVNPDSDDVDSQRVEQLTRHLEAVGARLGGQMSPKALTLRNKAQWFCNKLEMLNQTEEKLRQSVPAFADFNIITDTTDGSDQKD